MTLRTLQAKVLLLLVVLTGAGTAWADTVKDVLNRDLTGVTGTSYTEWSGKKSNSDAVYAGQSAGGNQAIQLRSTNNNSGVVTTASGGKVKKVAVTWNSNTVNGRTLNVYGKNAAYSTAPDLYNSSKQGTLVGTIVKGTSTVLEVSGDYEFIGFRSKSGAMYIDKVEIEWEPIAGGSDEPCEAPAFSLPAGTYTTAQSVEISCATAGATIYYTTDGTEPTTTSTVYSGPIAVGTTMTIKAIAVKGRQQSSVVTAAYVIDVAPFTPVTYTLAKKVLSGRHYIITNGADRAMGGQGTNNRAAVEIAIADGVATVSSDDVYEFVVYGPDADGYYAFYDERTPGYLCAVSSTSNWLRTKPDFSLNGRWSVAIADNGVATIKDEGTSERNRMRYNDTNDLFSAYSSGLKDVCLFERDGEAAPAETVSISGAKYATYCSKNALDFAGSGVTAYVARMNGTVVTFESVTKVPAFEGVLLKAAAAGDFTVGTATDKDDVKDNVFKGVTGQTTLTTSPDNGIFVLMSGANGVGFYKTKGSEFTLGAHTAYLPASVATARSFIGFGDETAAIEGIATKAMSGKAYNLHGQRVVKAQKGLFIVDGKKVVVR